MAVGWDAFYVQDSAFAAVVAGEDFAAAVGVVRLVQGHPDSYIPVGGLGERCPDARDPVRRVADNQETFAVSADQFQKDRLGFADLDDLPVYPCSKV